MHVNCKLSLPELCIKHVVRAPNDTEYVDFGVNIDLGGPVCARLLIHEIRQHPGRIKQFGMDEGMIEISLILMSMVLALHVCRKKQLSPNYYGMLRFLSFLRGACFIYEQVIPGSDLSI